MNYSQVIASGLIRPKKAKYTRKAADAYHTGRIDEARTQAEKILNDARTEARAIKASARRFLSDLAETI